MILLSHHLSTTQIKKSGKKGTLQNSKTQDGYYPHIRYDVHVDNLTNAEYTQYTEDLFNEFDRILNLNGVVLYNLSYSSENTTGMFEAINSVCQNTNFTIADVIIWKKKNAMPNNCSCNKLTRLCEFIFVMCRKDELKTFNCNKKVVSVRNNGQKMYENIFNFIEAKNNDESCPYNKATFSSELVEKLLNLYARPDGIVYDPFMGTGTTAVACRKLGFDFIGSEISEKQCGWSKQRLDNVTVNKDD